MRRADYEEITGAKSNDFPLQLCAHRWVENEVVAKLAEKAWPKVMEAFEYWQSPSKQPGQGKPENNKSFQMLLSCSSEGLIPLKFAFFEEITHKLNKSSRRFQTDAHMVPFLADTIEEILRELCNWFILNSIMDGAVKTQDLIIGGRGVLTPYFMKTPPPLYCLPPIFKV